MFAIAITLLTLEIALPAFAAFPSEAQLGAALLGLWPKVLAYALSFAVIGIMWQNHHALFRLVPRIDRMTVFLNLVLLALTAFIPFASSVLGSYPALRPAELLYGLVLTGCATTYNGILMHLVRSKAFSHDVTEATIRETVRAYRVGWVTYAVATCAAFVAPLLSFALYGVVALYYLFPRGVDSDRPT